MVLTVKRSVLMELQNPHRQIVLRVKYFFITELTGVDFPPPSPFFLTTGQVEIEHEYSM